ncbi:conserved hypothetical protein [Gammaproteobacteria bacterium]
MTEQAKVPEGPKWKLIVFAILALCVGGYLIWSHVRTPPPQPGAITHPAPAVSAAKVEGPKMEVPLQIVPPAAVLKKFSRLGPISPSNPVVDTAKIPRTDNGGATVTFMNTTTGKASTVFIPAAAPWFALEGKNYLGGSIGFSSEDKTVYRGYYKRDIAQVKGAFLQGEAQGIARPNAVDRRRAVEGIVWANVEYRW